MVLLLALLEGVWVEGPTIVTVLEPDIAEVPGVVEGEVLVPGVSDRTEGTTPKRVVVAISLTPKKRRLHPAANAVRGCNTTLIRNAEGK